MRTFLLAVVCSWLFCCWIDASDGTQQKKMYEAAMKQRERNGLQKQIYDQQLCEQANKWARYMASTGNFRHGGGEQIIARGYETPEKAINAWMRSQGHQRWILSRTSHVGFGFARSKSGHPYYVGVYRNKKK